MPEHQEAIQRAFTQQAGAFEDPEFNRLFTVDSDWLFERLELQPSDIVLDVAAGTGHVARGFAPKVRAVVAADATKAMLDRGWIEAKRAALRNIVFMQADAAALPFVDGSFDVVSVLPEGTSTGTGKIVVSDGRLLVEGKRGRGTGTLQRNPAGDLVLNVEMTLNDNSILTAKLWRPSR